MRRPRPRSVARSPRATCQASGASFRRRSPASSAARSHTEPGVGQVGQPYGAEVGDQLGDGIGQLAQPAGRAGGRDGGLADPLDPRPVERGGVRRAAVVVEDDRVQTFDEERVAAVLRDALAKPPGVDLGELVGEQRVDLAAAHADLGQRPGDHAGEAPLAAGQLTDQQHRWPRRTGDLLPPEAERPAAAPPKLRQQPIDIVGAGQERDAVRLHQPGAGIGPVRRRVGERRRCRSPGRLITGRDGGGGHRIRRDRGGRRGREGSRGVGGDRGGPGDRALDRRDRRDPRTGRPGTRDRRVGGRAGPAGVEAGGLDEGPGRGSDEGQAVVAGCAAGGESALRCSARCARAASMISHGVRDSPGPGSGPAAIVFISAAATVSPGRGGATPASRHDDSAVA